MAVFQTIKLTWKGEDFTLPADRVLMAISMVEEVLSLGDLATHQLRGRVPLAKLSMAFGIILRLAGVKVTDEEVYDGLFASGPGDLAARAVSAVATLQALMIPPERLREQMASGKRSATARKKPVGSSRNSSGSSSGKRG